MSTPQIAVVLLCMVLLGIDGFDVLAIGFAAPGITAEWGINRGALGIVLSMELLGMSLGSFLLGSVADRVGRRPTLLTCLLLMSFGMFRVAGATTILQLEVWRALTGVGIGGLLSACNAVAAEFSNSKRHDLCVSVMAVGYPLGAIAGGAIVAGLLHEHDWRAVFYFGAAVSAAAFPVVWILVPESVPWLADKQPTRALERINKTLRWLRHPQITSLPSVPDQKPRTPIAALFAPQLLPCTLIMTAAYFLHITTFYFILKWVPQIVADMQFPPSAAAAVLVWANVGGALGGITFGLFTRKFAARPATLVAMLLSTGFVTAFGHSSPSLAEISVGCACACFCTNAGVVGLYALLAKAFPTRARAVGTGFAIGIGRGGAIVSPIAAGMLFQAGFDLPWVAALMAMGSLFAASVLAFLRLPDSEAQTAVHTDRDRRELA
jgi:benzoate transport